MKQKIRLTELEGISGIKIPSIYRIILQKAARTIYIYSAELLSKAECLAALESVPISEMLEFIEFEGFLPMEDMFYIRTIKWEENTALSVSTEVISSNRIPQSILYEIKPSDNKHKDSWLLYEIKPVDNNHKQEDLPSLENIIPYTEDDLVPNLFS